MNPIDLAREIEERYLRYLKTTLYFRDPDLRASFDEVLRSGPLSKGPYLEGTPVFKRSRTPESLFQSLLGFRPDEGLLRVIHHGTPTLYKHQEDAIREIYGGQNVIVATGTGSGKTEAFLYPILLHLYQEYSKGTLCPGTRALILYPMNALANDQRERLGEICKRLKEEESPFHFTFGQYIGETPDHKTDTYRHAGDHLAERAQKDFCVIENERVVHGELVLRSEMRENPPHILLTNYSMLEYLLLRPDDVYLFDNGQARWWTFLVLDEAHQYRGSRGIEMGMLLRRLKQRLREGGRTEPFKCIATSATLVGGESDKAAVAKFASDLFDEEFVEENVVLGQVDEIPEPNSKSLSPESYRLLADVLCGKGGVDNKRLLELGNRLGISIPDAEPLPLLVSRLLQHDGRMAKLRQRIAGKPDEVVKVAAQIFPELPEDKRVAALSDLVGLLLQAKDPISGAPLLSARYHLFLRALEGAYVSYWPKKKVLLDRRAVDGHFEVALCKECGQHYFVGPKNIRSKLTEAIRDPSHVDFGASFFRPIETADDLMEEEEDENEVAAKKRVFRLCIQCGEIGSGELNCEHKNSISVVKEDSPNDEDKADQVAKCGMCGYNAAGRDPVREVVYGSDGPHAVIASTLYQKLPEGRKKVLAFADGRQEAAFFAWYLEDSYRDILSRNQMLRIARSFTPYPAEGISLQTITDKALHSFRNAFKERDSDDETRIRRNIWRALYNEFLTDEQRISLEGVGLVQWTIKWPHWLTLPERLKSPPWSLTEEEIWDLLFILLDFMRLDKAVELRTGSGVSLVWSDLAIYG